MKQASPIKIFSLIVITQIVTGILIIGMALFIILLQLYGLSIQIDELNISKILFHILVTLTASLFLIMIYIVTPIWLLALKEKGRKLTIFSLILSMIVNIIPIIKLLIELFTNVIDSLYDLDTKHIILLITSAVEIPIILYTIYYLIRPTTKALFEEQKTNSETNV